MLKANAWDEGDWNARTHQNLKVGHSLIYLYMCMLSVNHGSRQTIKGRSLVKGLCL